MVEQLDSTIVIITVSKTLIFFFCTLQTLLLHTWEGVGGRGKGGGGRGEGEGEGEREREGRRRARVRERD